ncbi:recombinase RecT [Rhodococcus sp. IEGM 1366]|uniref:recombinase RecT n=1 Tax=Rhodococcus sp. IEGM 1366 TaxID=3082223 RepID=UPI002953A211|nr:recombinase RecT [Rhodococcus sp. IEGM 1366]MDV8066412.1 recombinase RecT [Rhodococcus sp. IEGM 1366]
MNAPARRYQPMSQPARRGNNNGKEEPSLSVLIERMKPEMGRALPKHMDPDRMARIALTVLRQTPKLGECNPQSFLGALMTAAQCGLEPGPLGEAYLVPYGREVTFVPGYRGLVKLAWQSNQLSSIAAHVVHERDTFKFSYGLDPTLVHEPALRDRGDVIAAYAVATFKHGGNAFEVMPIEDIEAIRKRSKASNNGPWVTDWNQMARKTVLKRLSKWLPLSPEFADAIQRDGTVRTDVGSQLGEVAPSWIDPDPEDDGRVTAAEILAQGEEPASNQGAKPEPSQVNDLESEPVDGEVVEVKRVGPRQLKKIQDLLANWKYEDRAARLQYLQGQFADLEREEDIPAEHATEFIKFLESEQAADAAKAAESDAEHVGESPESA